MNSFKNRALYLCVINLFTRIYRKRTIIEVFHVYENKKQMVQNALVIILLCKCMLYSNDIQCYKLI